MMRILFVSLILIGCRPNVYDTLEGDWNGELFCNGVDYDVTARFFEDRLFEYSGQMRFDFEKDVVVSGNSGVFKAQLLYEFTTVQTASSGGQDVFLDMTWDKLYCEVEYEDSTEEGGCQNIGGIDTTTKGDKIGYVEMRYSGNDKLSIDDDNCEGDLYWEGAKD
jgi:hypothetical protein